MDATDQLLSEIFANEKKCEKCDSKLELHQKERSPIIIGTCKTCNISYSNVKPVVENGKLCFKYSTELRKMEKFPPW